jgi:glucan 1,3-beta-glucosidase
MLSRDSYLTLFFSLDFVFTPEDTNETASSHTHDIKTSILDELRSASDKARTNLVIQEWSCGLTPQSLAKDSDPKGARRTFCESQMYVYSNVTAGWGFWSKDDELLTIVCSS